MSESIDRHFFNVDLGRIAKLAPFWRQSFTNIGNFPAPAYFSGLSGADAQTAQQRAMGLIDKQLDPLQTSATPHTLYFYAAYRIARQEHASAVPVLQHLLATHPSDAALLFMRGMAHFGRGEHALAWGDFGRSLAANPASGHARLALAYLSGFARDHQQALSHSAALGPQLHELAQSWGAAQHIPLICFQAELLLRGRSESANFQSTLAGAPTPAEHAQALDAWLPPCDEVLAWRAPPTSSYFASCDAVYFHRFAVPLLLSHLDTAGPQGFHVHVVNPDAQVREVAARLSALFDGRLRITAESMALHDRGFASVYYSAGRFCRLAHFYLQSDISYYMIDADMLINRPLPEFEVDARSGGCHLSCAEAEPLWDYYLAGFGVFSHADQASADVLCRASHFIMQSIQAGKYRWFLDQVGLFLAAYQSQQEPRRLDFTAYCDLEQRDDSYIWAVTNDKALPRFEQRRSALLDQWGFSG